MNVDQPLTRYVLDHGFVELVNHSPHDADLMVANAARVSFNAWADEMGDAEHGLVNFLMRDHHGTPFEHNLFTWRVKAPIFVFREWHRHRTGSISEWSARYSQLAPEFYVPAVEDMRHQVGKPGSYTFEPLDPAEADGWRDMMTTQNDDAFNLYTDMLTEGVAKEVARTILPVATYTQMLWSVNARNLMGFLQLRNSPHAQLEIRRFAEAMETIWSEVMPRTAECFAEHGRVKP